MFADMIKGFAVRPILIAFVASVALAGCAKKTQDISATYVPASQYEPYLCSQLREEATRVSRRASDVFGDQNLKSSVGAAIYWPKAVVGRASGGSDEEVARLKGEMTAIEQASDAKRCGIEFQRAAADAGAPRYDAGGVKPDLRGSGNAATSLYNLPKSTMR